MENLDFISCNIADLEELQKLSIQTFTDTYQDKNEPVLFQNHLDLAFNSHKLKSELENPESFFFFVKREEELLGYLKLNVGAAQTEAFGNDSLEIERIYVVQKYQGHGLGRLLIEKSIAFAGSKNKKKVWLGVWEENPKAIAFYKRMGFEVVGTHVFMMGTEAQKDFVMELLI